MNPNSVARIFLAPDGSVPVVGADTTALGSEQPEDAALTYSTAGNGPDVLTIAYKTDAARTKVYRYDGTANPAIQTATGLPIWVVTAVGRVGSAKRTIVTEIVNKQFTANLKGAVVSNDEIDLKEDTNANGYDHRADTPTFTGADGNRATAWETTNPPKAGAWSRKNVHADGKLQGTPLKLEKQTGFYGGPWEVLNMTQEEFTNWIGEPNGDHKQGNPRGITYVAKVDDNGKIHHGEHFEWKGGFNGDGILYVDGDLDIRGDFTFRGLIYCTGEFRVHGTAWILGGVVSGKHQHIHSKKDKPMSILMSSEAVTQNLNRSSSLFSTLSWREIQ
jgi:hypothetical protein